MLLSSQVGLILFFVFFFQFVSNLLKSSITKNQSWKIYIQRVVTFPSLLHSRFLDVTQHPNQREPMAKVVD